MIGPRAPGARSGCNREYRRTGRFWGTAKEPASSQLQPGRQRPAGDCEFVGSRRATGGKSHGVTATSRTRGQRGGTDGNGRAVHHWSVSDNRGRISGKQAVFKNRYRENRERQGAENDVAN